MKNARGIVAPQQPAELAEVAVDVQGVEVRREASQRQPQIAAVAQGGGVLRVDVGGRADLGVAARGRRRLVTARTGGEHEADRERGHGEASGDHADRL